MNKHSYAVNIEPKKIICNQRCYNIEILNKKYIIKALNIYTDKNNFISKIEIIDGEHPNCDPETKEFCIPENLKERKFDSIDFSLIEKMIGVFDFNSSFYMPWADFNIID
jgi:hypothetical protein